VDVRGELARERARGAARGGLGARIDQVGHGLGLGQVQLVVEKRPLGEFPGLRGAQARQRESGHLQAARKQELQHHRPAMRLQLEHVLAGVAARRGKPQREPPVDGLAARIRERQVMHLARLRIAAEQRPHEARQGPSRDAHDAHRAAPRGRGDGDDGIVMARQRAHGQCLQRSAGAAKVKPSVVNPRA